jgi:hypothetical protein
MSLKCETNTRSMEARILAAFAVRYEERIVSAEFEHSNWWIVDLDSGEQFAVVDAEGEPAIDGFDFESIGGGES